MTPHLILGLLLGCPSPATDTSSTARHDTATPGGHDTADTACEQVSWWPDDDGDGYGDSTESPAIVCVPPDPSWVQVSGDCDDTDAAVSPDGVDDTCNGLDDDCSGTVDDGQDVQTWYRDDDSDGWGVTEDSTETCDPPDGWTPQDGDCDDTESTVNPGEEELCGNDVDEDCNGAIASCRREGGASFESADVLIEGWGSFTTAGVAVSSVGDLDGDGAGDFVIGGAGDCVYGSHRLSGDPRGAFFAYGPLSDGVVVDDLVNVEADPYYYQSLGASAANLGDMTGDGVAEVALGAPGCWGSGWDTGIVYVHNGPPAGGDRVTGTDWIALTGADDGGMAAVTLTGGGDLTGDGGPDLVVGSPEQWLDGYTERPGMVFVFDEIPTADGWMADADHVITGITDEAEFGSALASIGDSDGDGVDDLIIGAPHLAGGKKGRAYLFLGPLTGDPTADDADLYWAGEITGQALGAAVEAAGDADGDGLADVWLGSPGCLPATTCAYEGQVELVLGPFDTATPRATLAATIQGADADDRLGARLHGDGDVDGDGAPDVILGVADADGAGGLSAGGQALLFYGPVTGTWTSDDADFTIKGAESYDSVGINVQFLDDVNADGSDDMLVGSYGRTSDDGRSYAGAVGLFFSGVSE